MSTQSIINHAHRISPELARFINDVAERKLQFRGERPVAHSSHNHVHLWALEWWADRDTRINLDFRCEAVDFIVARWKQRLQGYQHWQQHGFTFYLYSDMAPTLTVVARAGEPPMFDDSFTFVPRRRDVLARYVHQSWSAIFSTAGPDPVRALLKAVEDNAGSIGTPTARALGVSVAQLRRQIEGFDLAESVNTIRKRYRRRPAQFRTEQECIDAGLRGVRVHREHYTR